MVKLLYPPPKVSEEEKRAAEAEAARRKALLETPHETHDAAKTFTELPLNDLLQENLKRANFTTPTPIQARALGPALAGRDVLGTAQTGTGKTLAFMLPILERLLREKGTGVEALILVPTRELAMQVMDTFDLAGRGSGISAALVVGGLSEKVQLDAVRRGARVVIATPGRLHDYVLRRLVNLRSVKILVLDEADRMVDMGFLPQMRSIMRDVARERQSMCFAATLSPEVEHLVHDYLTDPVRVAVGSTTRTADTIVLRIYEVPREKKLPLLVRLLDTEPGTFLVFTRTKRGANNLYRRLLHRGYDAEAIHGDLSQARRTRALEGFKTGSHRILVATDIAARGIHVDDIAHVVNFDIPQEPETFIHRVGRTGRIEKTGTATTFVAPEEVPEIRAIERLLGATIERLPVPADLPSTVQMPSGPVAAPRPERLVSLAPRSSEGGSRRRRRR